MDSILKKFIDELPQDNTSEKDKKKIKALLPVPKEQNILWSHIISKGGYPSAFVITDKAFIFKLPKKDVKDINLSIKEENKSREKGKKKNKLKYLYRLIPWEHYSPDLLPLCVKQNTDGTTAYSINVDGLNIELPNDSLYTFFERYNNELNSHNEFAENISFSVLDSFALRNTIYNMDNGVSNTNTGHGIYAEDVGSKVDKLFGDESTVVGRDNAKNGPDKIVNGINVQCKYCNSASSSINHCFDKTTTNYRYVNLDGSPMQVEVPADQYAEAINIMKEKIIEGKVPNVSNPDMAEKIVRKGKITYSQARNLAKAGTIESLAFDASNCMITCASVMGISALVSFALNYWKTKSIEEAGKEALFTGVQVFGSSFVGNVVSSQLARSSAYKTLNPFFTFVSKIIGLDKTQNIVNIMRMLGGKKAIYGAAAKSNFVKLLSTNLLSGAVLISIYSIPDFYKTITGKMTKVQLLKNLTALVGSFGGSAIGSKIGGKIGKGWGPAGFIGGVIGGSVVGLGVKAIGNLFREDDSVIYGRLIYSYITISIIDNMLSDEEQNKVIAKIQKDKRGIKKLVGKLIKCNNQEEAIREYVDKKIKRIVSKRERIDSESESVLGEGLLDFYRGASNAV